jgi:hypothetical protein
MKEKITGADMQAAQGCARRRGLEIFSFIRG